MFYVVVQDSRFGLSVYPVPTRERAKTLARCMGGFWKLDVVGVSDIIPEGRHTVHTSADENYYCVPVAIDWRLGMPRVVWPK